MDCSTGDVKLGAPEISQYKTIFPFELMRNPWGDILRLYDYPVFQLSLSIV